MHVDVIKNEWLAGFQYVAARVTLDDDHLSFESGEPDVWEKIVWRPLEDAESGDLVYPEKDPHHFLDLLPANIHGSYLWATTPHEVGECKFDHVVVSMQPAGPVKAAQGDVNIQGSRPK